MPGSEERSFSWNPGASWVTIGTDLALLQDREVKGVGDLDKRLQPEFRKSILRPTRPSAPGFTVGSPSSVGGSDTTSSPSTLKNGAAHSAVTDGRPKDRATTASNLPLSVRIPSQLFGAAAQNFNPRARARLRHPLAQKRAPSLG